MKTRFDKNKKKSSIKARTPEKKNIFSTQNIYIFILIALTAVLFSNTLNNAITSWDDDKYIIENPYIKDLSSVNISKFFTESYFGNYHPLTTLSYALEYNFFGLNPKIFHFTNYLLHIINSLLVFVFVRLISKQWEISLITALLFAVHPMHVESVAWVSERKDVLYTMFLLISMIFSVKYIQSGSKNVKHIIIAFCFFVLSLMSKSAAVIMSPTLLILFYFINKKITIKDVLTTIPFFALSVIFGIVAINAQGKAIGDTSLLYSLFNRILLIIYAVYFYIIRFIVPFNFSALHKYPFLQNDLLPLEYYVAPFVLLIIVIICFLSKKEFRHHLVFGLLFFLINISLVIQIIPFGKAIVSERYTYVPYIGLSFIFAHIFIILKKKFNFKISIIGIVYLLFLIVSTWQQNKVWSNDLTLWTKAINVNPNLEEAYDNRGKAKSMLGDYDGAITDYTRVIEINPTANAYNNRGDVKNTLGDFNGAILDYNKAIEMDPRLQGVYNNRGNAKKELGDFTGALNDYNTAIDLNQKFVEGYFNRALVKDKLRDLNGALSDLNIAISLSPKFLAAFFNRGNLKYALGDYNGAINDFSSAIALNPEYAEAYNNRGAVKYKLKNYSSATEDFNKAINFNSNYGNAYYNRASLEFETGNKDAACLDWQKAAQLGYKDAQTMLHLKCK